MHEILNHRLRECGLDVELLSTSPVLSHLPKVNRAIYICKDTKGVIGLLGVPETAWHFQGIVYFVNHLMLLIDKEVAADWGIL
jgi:hypothetical protein